ncbi:unnamed protein product [Absidia cylindrospora]
MADKSQSTQNTSSMPNQKNEHHPWRRGSQMASERDLNGIRSRTSTGFSTTAAKFDDTWGNNAFTETGFTETGYSDDNNNSVLDSLKDSVKDANVGK